MTVKNILEQAVDIDSAGITDEPGDGSKTGKSGTVMVITPGNQIEVRKVLIGMETANRIEIRSGLQEGDFVVIGNRGSLQPGERVRPKVTTIGAGA